MDWDDALSASPWKVARAAAPRGARNESSARRRKTRRRAGNILVTEFFDGEFMNFSSIHPCLLAAPAQIIQQDGDNALCRVAIPQRRYSAAPGAAGKRVIGRGKNARGIEADDGVGAFIHGDRALGALAQSKAGHTERGGFLLNAAGIGEHAGRGAHQVQKFKITERGNKPHAASFTDPVGAGLARGWRRAGFGIELTGKPERAQAFRRTRVRGKKNRNATTDLSKRPGQRREALDAVDIGGTMQSYQDEGPSD